MECCSIFDGVVKLVSSMALPEVHTDRGDLRVHESLEELSTDLVDYIDEISETSMKERGVFAIVLSGGSLIGSIPRFESITGLCGDVKEASNTLDGKLGGARDGSTLKQQFQMLSFEA
ncbi:hypothetical protein QYF36_010136 [Acer negundo]|nr:hypothetical protein QYF36_010136 [Acer negundo]